MFLTFILVVLPHLLCADAFIIKGTKRSFKYFQHSQTLLTWLPLQSESQSGSLILSQSSHWTSKPSWTTLVPRGAVSSPWKTTTMKVGISFVHVEWPTNILSAAQPGLCPWRLTSAMLRWHLSIGSTAEVLCSGSFLLADETLNVAPPLWRQGTGIVVHFASARVSEEECCQLSLAKPYPQGSLWPRYHRQTCVW